MDYAIMLAIEFILFSPCQYACYTSGLKRNILNSVQCTKMNSEPARISSEQSWQSIKIALIEAMLVVRCGACELQVKKKRQSNWERFLREISFQIIPVLLYYYYVIEILLFPRYFLLKTESLHRFFDDHHHSTK